MLIEHIKIEEIVPNEWNPNRMSVFQFEVLKGDIKENGLRYPIIITKAGTILDGEHRWRALQELGAKEIPCFISDVSEKDVEAKIITITTNQLRGKFKDELLGDVLKQIHLELPKHTISELSTMLGFAERELEMFVVDTDILKEPIKDISEDAPEQVSPKGEKALSITFVFKTKDEYEYVRSYFTDETKKRAIDVKKLLHLIEYTH